MVTDVDGSGVTVKSKSGTGTEHIASHTVIWAAGVAVSEFGRQLAKQTSAETDRAGIFKVSPDLTLPNYPGHLRRGRSGLRRDARQALPGVAQVAMQTGAYAAKTIVATLKDQPDEKPFIISTKGTLR